MGRSLDEISAPVPVGGLLQLAGASGPNPTIDGAEYLKTSVLKAIAGYEGLVSSAVDVTAVVATPALTVQSAVDGALIAANGYTYGGPAASGTALRYTTNPVGVAWQDVAVASSAVTDAFVFGTRAIIVPSVSSLFSLLNGALTTVTMTLSQNSGAANDAGTLAVTARSVNGVAGNITTSTNGTAWTDRTPTGGFSSTVVACDWNQPGGLFFFVGQNGHVYTAADGYTLTDRGAIAGATAVSISGNAFKSKARSATSSIMLLTLTIGGVTTPHIVRTTDGVTYSATPLATTLQLDGFAPVLSARITYIAGKYVIYQASASGVASSIFYTSADDGLTWQKNSVPVNPALPTTALALLAPGNSGQILALYSTTVLTVLPGLTATHVGVSKPLSDVAPYYVRIK